MSCGLPGYFNRSVTECNQCVFQVVELRTKLHIRLCSFSFRNWKKAAHFGLTFCMWSFSALSLSPWSSVSCIFAPYVCYIYFIVAYCCAPPLVALISNMKLSVVKFLHDLFSRRTRQLRTKLNVPQQGKWLLGFCLKEEHWSIFFMELQNLSNVYWLQSSPFSVLSSSYNLRRICVELCRVWSSSLIFNTSGGFWKNIFLYIKLKIEF